MTPVRFTIPGKPRGKGRPRATARGKFIRIYTDDQTASYENLVALAAKAAMQGRAPMTGAVSLTVTVNVEVPKSASRKARAAMLAGEQRPAKKPDLTNCLKAIEDGANAIVYADDAQIVFIQAWKVYAETPGVEVLVREIDTAFATPLEPQEEGLAA